MMWLISTMQNYTKIINYTSFAVGKCDFCEDFFFILWSGRIVIYPSYGIRHEHLYTTITTATDIIF